MKRFILAVLILFLSIPANAKIITGEVEYNAKLAHDEVFENHLTPINFNYIKNRLIDLNAEENINAISLGIKKLNDRRIAGFSDGSYGVVYYDDPLYSWYYKNGRLINFTQKSSETYPCKITKYKPDGTIANAGYKVSETESYIFSPEGILLAHWIGTLCYDKNNNIIMTRKNL